jgi:hypothetical protein
MPESMLLHTKEIARETSSSNAHGLGAVTRIQSSCQYLVEVSSGSFVLERRYEEREEEKAYRDVLVAVR